MEIVEAEHDSLEMEVVTVPGKRIVSLWQSSVKIGTSDGLHKDHVIVDHPIPNCLWFLRRLSPAHKRNGVREFRGMRLQVRLCTEYVARVSGVRC